jgi:MFS family permease
MVYNNFILLMICLMLAGWGVVFMTPSITAFIAMHYPSNLVGSVSGLWFGLGSYGGAAALYIGGLTVSRFGVYNIAISMITAFALLGLLVTFFLKPPRL